ncbi:MAG: MFS transporter [Cellulomonadaceae bacterium]|jgi:EmrB/QacA subfamily drug resistance transporter|nr:MFS transporter [Cellulomonadaceae bacterium]
MSTAEKASTPVPPEIEVQPATGAINLSGTPTMSQGKIMESLSGIMLGMFVSLLATTITSSSMPHIVSDLGGSQSSFTWVITAILLTQTISTPIWGKLADLTDRKRLIQIALVITVVSAAAAGFAHNVTWLIACRAFQGIGAGGLTSLSTVLVADIVSPRDRGKYMGIMGGVMAVSQVGGPLLGGVLTDSVGWRWNFFIAAPFALLAALVLQRNLKLPPVARKVAKIDYWGALLISVGVALLLLWITFAGTNFTWISWQTFVMVGAALAALVGAVMVERVVDEPIIPMHLFSNRTFVLAVIGSVAVGVALFGSSVFLSQYLQMSREKTPTQSGLLTIPMVIGTLTAGIVFGRIISKTGRYKAIMVGGGVVLTGALLGLSTISATTSLVEMGVLLFALGLSVGALMQNLVLAVQNTLARSEMGSGTAAVAFFRTLGGAVGVSALGAVLATTVRNDVARGIMAAGVTPAQMQGFGDSIPNPATLEQPIRGIIETAYADGIAHVFRIAVPMAVIALIAVVLMKEIPLGKRSGIEEAMEAANAAMAKAEAPAAGADGTDVDASDAPATPDAPATADNPERAEG